MTDYNGYVHCGEVFRSSILSNEKPYIFKCIQCQDILQLEAFRTHFEQSLCELREITIKEEFLDDGCLSGCPEKDINEGINSNSIDEIEVNQASLVFKTAEDVSNADKKDHVRYEIESSDAEVDAEQQEFETDVSLDDDLNLDGHKYDSEDSSVTDETEYLVKRKQGNEEETIYSREFVSNYIENHDNVMALIEAYKAQTPLWHRSTSFRNKKERQKYLEIVTKGLNLKRNLHLHWKQVSTLIMHLRRNYRDDLKQFKDSQKQKTTYRSLWFSKHMEFLQPFMENNYLVVLDPHLPILLHEQIVQIMKIYENLPHLWNTSLIEHRCKNKRRESEMEMIKRIEATLGYEIDCEALNKYLKNIHHYFLHEKRAAQNDEQLENCELYQHLVFLLDHVGPFRCSLCDFENDSIFNYKVHLSEHDGSMPFKCSQCGKEFKQIRSYDIHVRNHFEDFKNICQECGRKFWAPYHLRRHMRIHMNVRDCICKTCGKAFKTTDNLRTHEVTHSDVRKYVCTICSKSFKIGSRLTQHMRIHGRNLSEGKTTTREDKMADYICKTCGKAFKTARRLRLHEVTHSEVRKYVCTICSKSFKIGCNLAKHMRTHGRNLSDDKTTTRKDNMTDFICKTCGKAFTTTYNLRNHEVTHSDVRKYVCTICSKSFKLGCNLAKHMRTHGRNLSDDKTTTRKDKMADCICKTCGKAFKTKQHLRDHEVTHSDVRKYVCKICSKCFKLRSTLTQHMRIHGRNKSDDKTTTSNDKMEDTEIIVKDNLNEIL